MDGIETLKSNGNISMEELILTDVSGSCSMSSDDEDSMDEDLYGSGLGILNLPLEILQLIVSKPRTSTRRDMNNPTQTEKSIRLGLTFFAALSYGCSNVLYVTLSLQAIDECRSLKAPPTVSDKSNART